MIHYFTSYSLSINWATWPDIANHNIQKKKLVLFNVFIAAFRSGKFSHCYPWVISHQTVLTPTQNTDYLPWVYSFSLLILLALTIHYTLSNRSLQRLLSLHQAILVNTENIFCRHRHLHTLGGISLQHKMTCILKRRKGVRWGQLRREEKVLLALSQPFLFLSLKQRQKS